MNLQIAKWGNSLALRLPATLARQFGLHEGDTVDAQLTVDGSLTIRPQRWSRSRFAAELEQAHAGQPKGSSVIDELRRNARY